MTLGQVAKQAGVAIDTARRALQNAPSVRPYIRERVLKAAAELDYQPNLLARALRDKQFNLMPISVNPFNEYYFGMLSFELARQLVGIGMEPALCYDAEHLLRVCKSFRTRGCVLAAGCTDEVLHELAKGRKLVTIHSAQPETAAANVVLDFNTAYRKLTRRLLAGGRKKIAIVSQTYLYAKKRKWPLDKFPVVFNVLRRNGLAPVGPEPERVFASSADFCVWLREHPGSVDAVLCENDIAAAGAVGGMARLGLRTPEDVHVVGCDANLLLPGMWSVRLDTGVIANQAVTLLRQLLDSEILTGGVVYHPALVDDQGNKLPL